MSRLRRLTLPPSTGSLALDSWMREVTSAFADGLFNFREVSSNYSLTPEDQIVEAVTTSGIVLTMPNAVGARGKVVPTIKNMTGGDIYVNGLNGQLFDGSLTTVTLADTEAITSYSNNTGWRIT